VSIFTELTFDLFVCCLVFRESRGQFTSEGQAECTSSDKGRCLRHIHERNGRTVV